MINQVDVDLSEIKSEKERREQESENRSSTLTKQIFSLQSDNRDLQDKLSKLRLEQTQSHKNLVPLRLVIKCPLNFLFHQGKFSLHFFIYLSITEIIFRDQNCIAFNLDWIAEFSSVITFYVYRAK